MNKGPVQSQTFKTTVMAFQAQGLGHAEASRQAKALGLKSDKDIFNTVRKNVMVAGGSSSDALSIGRSALAAPSPTHLTQAQMVNYVQTTGQNVQSINPNAFSQAGNPVPTIINGGVPNQPAGNTGGFDLGGGGGGFDLGGLGGIASGGGINPLVGIFLLVLAYMADKGGKL